jgi:methylenetetrahydrofolate reductase (NADPH)
LLKSKSGVSFEVFPPNKNMSIDAVKSASAEISALNPSFISVTCGAGGGVFGETLEISLHIKNELNSRALTHIACTALSRLEVANMVDNLAANGLTSVLALRGDRRDDEPADRFPHASDLTEFIKSRGDFVVGGACYPEGHFESGSLEADVANLKIKVDKGCDFLITQMFFDNDYFYAFAERCAARGINVPIIAGLMPVTRAKSVKRMAQLSNAEIPDKLLKIIDKYGENNGDMMNAGLEYVINQARGLKEHGFGLFHFYTMNNPVVARAIHSGVVS